MSSCAHDEREIDDDDEDEDEDEAVHTDWRRTIVPIVEA